MKTTTHRPARTFESIKIDDPNDLSKAMSHLSQIVNPKRLGDPKHGPQYCDHGGFHLVVDQDPTPAVPWGSYIVYGHGIDDRVTIMTMTQEDVDFVLGPIKGGTVSQDKVSPVAMAAEMAANVAIDQGSWVKIDDFTSAMPIDGIGVLVRITSLRSGAMELVHGACLRESFDVSGQQHWTISKATTGLGAAGPGTVYRANGDVQANPNYDPFADGLREAAQVVAIVAESRLAREQNSGVIGADDELKDISAEDVVTAKVCADITERLMSRIKACAQKTFSDPPRAIGKTEDI
jgi:hypothetical protein